MSVLQKYLEEQIKNNKKIKSEMVAYLANLEQVANVDKKVTKSIIDELVAQRGSLKMIASENYCSIPVQLALGNILTDKYAEGYPNHRYYVGCENIDAIENIACCEAKKLFGAEHAYVQPHSGADANMVAYWAILGKKIQEPWLAQMKQQDISKFSNDDWKKLRAKLNNQRLFGLNYYSGGHLTHGYRHNVSARMFDAYCYDVNPKTQILDYHDIEKQAREIKPTILLAGYSAYPRAINFKRMREIADKVGATFMVDMAHFAGLVAGKVFQQEFNPIPYAHIVTTTTHKTLRGPRGGLILCKEEFADWVNQGCPLVLGGPISGAMAAKAIAFQEANTPEFAQYAHQVVKNSKALADEFMKLGAKITSDGTDNHLIVIDIRNFELTGRQAESAIRQVGITLNRNSIPFDPNGAWYTSGLRLGTPALTTRGMKEEQMRQIAQIIVSILEATQANTITSGKNAGKKSKAKATTNPTVVKEAAKKVNQLLEQFELYPQLDSDILYKLTN